MWDTKGGRVTGRSSAALETNRLLDKIRVSINRHYQEIMERDNFVTAEKVKNAFLGLEHRCHTLMQVFRQHNEDYAKQVEAGMKAKATLSKYLVVYKHLQEFLNIRYHVKDIALKIENGMNTSEPFTVRILVDGADKFGGALIDTEIGAQ